MLGQITDSRFYMWRAVFAMAHADGKVTQEEIDFIEGYLDKIAFTEQQKMIIRDDLRNPKKVGDMLSHVVNPDDRSDFFQFSTMLAWSDGDYAVSEKAVIERLLAEQMDHYNEQELLEDMHQARAASALRRALEDEEYKKQAEKVAGISNIVRYIVPWMVAGDFQAPDEKMFRLWRAVFSLAHADGEISPEEVQYVEAMIEVFHFTDEQKKIIKEDLKNSCDIIELFNKIEGKEYRRQFFVMARTILWCDGFLHEMESKAIDDIVAQIGDEAKEYTRELRWINRRPVAEYGASGESAEEKMMRDIMTKMFSFYKDLSE